MRNSIFLQLISNRELKLLGFSSLFCVSMSLVRMQYTGTEAYFFLNWNLFLAFVPWAITQYQESKNTTYISWFRLIVILSAWLLFFPNAPYILTDLFHLRYQSSVPLWYDLIMIVAYAWTGLLYGFISLMKVEKLLKEKLASWQVQVLIPVLLLLTGFGIYLGRFLRWNSWDILSAPGKLFYDIAHRIIYPLQHPSTWGMTLLMGTLLIIMYQSLKYFKRGSAN